MPKTLEDIVTSVAEVYPDHYLQKNLRKPERASVNLTDALADYVITEMKELYDPKSDDKANLQRIMSSLERSIDQLYAIIDQLKSLSLNT